MPDFEKVFKVFYDALGVGIATILSQEGKSIAYVSEKLNGSQKNYSTYDKDSMLLLKPYPIGGTILF